MIITVVLCALFMLLVSTFVLFMFGILLPVLKNNADLSFLVFPASQAEYQLKRTRVYPRAKGFVAVKKPINQIQKDLSYRLKFIGKKDCQILTKYYESMCDCKDECVGAANCIRVCPQDAIKIKDFNITITKDCIGCSLCVDACPKSLLILQEKHIDIDDTKNYKSFDFYRFCDRMICSLEERFK